MKKPAEGLGTQNLESLGSPDSILQVEDALICSGIEPMSIPVGGAHVRAAEIRIPAKFAGRPTVTATVSPRTGPGGVGTVFGIFSIKVNDLGTETQPETQVVIQATNVQKGVPVEGDFACDYVIIGKVEDTK